MSGLSDDMRKPLLSEGGEDEDALKLTGGGILGDIGKMKEMSAEDEDAEVCEETKEYAPGDAVGYSQSFSKNSSKRRDTGNVGDGSFFSQTTTPLLENRRSSDSRFSSIAFLLRLMRKLWNCVCVPVRLIVSKMTSFLHAFYDCFFSPSIPKDFTSFFETLYGVNHPVFTSGSYAEALTIAHQDLKLLVVYIHSETSEESLNVCKNIFTDELLQSILNENFILWASEIGWKESNAIVNKLASWRYPYLAVILPLGNGAWEKLELLAHPSQASEVVLSMTEWLMNIDSLREKMTASQRRRELDRSLREEQDKEFLMAQQKDAEKIQKEIEESARLRLAAIEEESKREQKLKEKLLKKKAKELAKSQRLILAKEFQEEAKEIDLIDKSKRTKICIKLPTGARFERYFSTDAPVCQLYKWAECLEVLYQDRKRINLPINFLLNLPHSNTELKRDMDTSFKDAGLYPNSVIYLHSLDDSEDELEDEEE